MARLLSPSIPWRDFAGQYLVGNLLGAVGAIVAATIVKEATHSQVLAALAATIADDVVWYVYLTIYNLRHGDSLGPAIRHLASDFGLAEAFDSLAVRPGLFYLVPILTHQESSGILIATVIADMVYTFIALNQQRRRTTQ
jgi:hypothetical protein